MHYQAEAAALRASGCIIGGQAAYLENRMVAAHLW
jgi:hypothetical protein